MGMTQDSMDRLNRHNLLVPSKVLVLGCQNLYFDGHYHEIAHPYLQRLGIDVSTWDICGCQGAEIVDLREPQEGKNIYDSVWDFGTTEHVDGNYYMALKNIHNLCKVGGTIVRENPKTGHWIGHGCNYVDMKFYQDLAALCGYKVMELTEHFAMGNVTDGCNVCVVLMKMTDNDFISESEFNKLTVFKS